MKRSFRYLTALAPLLLGAPARAVEPLPNVNAYYIDKPVAAGALPSPAGAPLAVVASTDAQRGVPTFLWAIQGVPGNPPLAARGLSPADAARFHLAGQAARYGLSPAALSTAGVTRMLDLGRGGIVVVLRQRVAGVDVFHNDVKVLMDRGLRLVAIGGNLHAGAVPTPKTPGFVRSEAQAITHALRDLYGAALGPADVVDLQRTKADYRYYGLAAGVAVQGAAIRLTDPVRVKRVFFPLPGRVVPAYYLEIIASTRSGLPSDAYAYVIAADDGRLLYRENLTHHDTFSYRLWADQTGDMRPADGPIADYTPHPTGVPDGSYPPFVSSSLISIDGFNKTADPWLPSGATMSQGNNVDAYTDDNNPEGFSPGDTRALTTSPNTFDHTYDTSAGPQSSLEQREAAVTSMFYVTNWLHDWWYDSGFDEQGGNAQQSNYGRGGVEGDPLLAEGQDGAPMQRNNSDMVVLQDGASPRMHMFVWDGLTTASLVVQPGNLTPSVGVAGFGPQSFATTTGAAVLADDGTGPDVNDACEAIVNGAAVSGNVAVVDRGNCSFKQKALNAQAAGAIAVVLVDNQPNEPAPFLGDDPSLTTAVSVPILSVSQADGDTIKAAIQGGVTAALTRSVTPDRDGTIDNTVIAHEWAHYLHLRQVACSSQQCGAESEGWGDFDALMMVLRQGDALGGTFALAQYATASFPDDPAYFGIRRYHYSVDLTKSPLTFKYIADSATLPTGAPLAVTNAMAPNSEVHAAGEIWASMLFEGYVAMLQQTQGKSPPYTFAEARRRMSDYIVAGMTMAPADPTYTEQRDAILAAAAAADPNDMALLAQGFAKRGAGTCAVSPARDSMDLSGVVESFTVAPNLAVTSIAVDDSVMSCDDSDGYLDAGETGKVTVQVTNTGPAPLKGATATVTTTTPGVTFPAGPTVSFGDVGIFAAAQGTVQIALDPSVQGKKNLDLKVTAEGAAAGCKNATLSVAPFINVVEEPGAATVDDVEAKHTKWTLGGTGANQIWSRLEVTPGNHVWAGVDFSSPSDTYLVSPKLDVSPTEALVLSFTHAHSFESSMNVNWDGGVIEISSDVGKTWTDISTYGDPGYGGTIGDPANMAMNVLKGRQGYVATNPSWPGTDKVSIDMGTKLAGKTVQIRFRIGTDDAQGDVGWRLDDIGLKGITNEPFAALVADTVPCGAQMSTASSGGTGGAGNGSGGTGGTGGSSGAVLEAGGGCGCVTAGDAPGRALAAPLLALSALLVRRRSTRKLRRSPSANSTTGA